MTPLRRDNLVAARCQLHGERFSRSLAYRDIHDHISEPRVADMPPSYPCNRIVETGHRPKPNDLARRFNGTRRRNCSRRWALGLIGSTGKGQTQRVPEQTRRDEQPTHSDRQPRTGANPGSTAARWRARRPLTTTPRLARFFAIPVAIFKTHSGCLRSSIGHRPATTRQLAR